MKISVKKTFALQKNSESRHGFSCFHRWNLTKPYRSASTAQVTMKTSTRQTVCAHVMKCHQYRTFCKAEKNVFCRLFRALLGKGYKECHSTYSWLLLTWCAADEPAIAKTPVTRMHWLCQIFTTSEPSVNCPACSVQRVGIISWEPLFMHLQPVPSRMRSDDPQSLACWCL